MCRILCEAVRQAATGALRAYSSTGVVAAEDALVVLPVQWLGTGGSMTEGDQRSYERTVPKLAQLGRDVLYGDVWERPGLSKRDRSLITVAALVTSYRPEQLRGHMLRALENGVTAEELTEAVAHLAFYAGWPSAVTAADILGAVLDGRGE
jgi:4-carboxymuconolactone decarboxylase